MIDTTKLFEGDLGFAESRIMDRGELAPMFSVHFEKDGQDGVAAIIGDFANYEAKMQSVNMVKIVAVAMDAYAVSLMTEAWVAHIDKNTDQAVKDLAPSERMDRKEIVMVTMSRRDAGPLFSAREIQRDADGKVTGLLADTAGDHTGFEGRMANLLPERRPTAREQRSAQSLLRLLGITMEKLNRDN
jgi:hypothetical protein